MNQHQPSSRKSPLLTRRRFVGTTFGGLATGVGFYEWATRVEPHWLQITEHMLPIANLPTSFDGKRLVQISDFHIGMTDEHYLFSAIDKVNQLRPDILVLTGDFIDHNFADATNAVHRVFSLLNPGSIATLGCLGNHDYGRRWAEARVADRVVDVMSEMGVRVLRDEHVDVGGLDVYGLDDYWSPRFDARTLMRRANPSNASLCLCHNPDVCDRPVWGDFQGVILAGHTHGGQCKPPYLPPPRLPVVNRNYVGGFYDVGPGRTLYINRGIGYGFKARFNCRPEITSFTLQTLES